MHIHPCVDSCTTCADGGFGFWSKDAHRVDPSFGVGRFLIPEDGEKFSVEIDDSRPDMRFAAKYASSPSRAVNCEMAETYRLLGAPWTKPEDDQQLVFMVGNLIHGYIQHKMQQKLGARDEVPITIPSTPKLKELGYDNAFAGFCDNYLPAWNFPVPEVGIDGSKPVSVVFEWKSEGDFGYSLATGQSNRKYSPPHGPKLDHLVQAALCAYALDADYVCIGYFAKSPMSAAWKRRKGRPDIDIERGWAEWWWKKEDYWPVAEAAINDVENRMVRHFEKGLAGRRRISSMNPQSELTINVGQQRVSTQVVPGLITVDSEGHGEFDVFEWDTVNGRVARDEDGQPVVVRTESSWKCQSFCDHVKFCKGVTAREETTDAVKARMDAILDAEKVAAELEAAGEELASDPDGGIVMKRT